MSPLSRRGGRFAAWFDLRPAQDETDLADARAIRDEQIRALAAGTGTSVAANAVVAILFVAVLHDTLPSSRLAVWAAILATVLAVRYALAAGLRRRQPSEPGNGAWGASLLLAITATGGAWGGAGFALLPPDMIHQAFVGVVLAGIVAGAASALAVSFMAYAAFVVPAVLPFVSAQIVLGQDASLHYGMGALAAVFTLVMLLIGERLASAFEAALHARLRDARATSALQASHAEAAAACESLREEVRQRREAQARSQRSETRLRLYVEQSPIPFIEWDPAFRVLEWNGAASRLFGYSRDEALGRSASELLAVEGGCDEISRLWSRLLRDRRGSTVRTLNRTRDGRGIQCEWHYTPLVDATGRITSLITLALDATDRGLVEARLEHLVSRDALTGLASRALFLEEVALRIAQAGRSGGRLAVIVLDLDRFRLVNESLGQVHGDLLLAEAARRVADAAPEGAVAARHGEDEFALAFDPDRTDGGASLAAVRILEAFRAPFMLAGHETFLTASVGVAVFPYDADGPTALVENAGAAMSQAKRRGRDNVQGYSAELTRLARLRLGAETNLRLAVEREAFTVLYQPLVDLHTGEITGVEALLRWRDGERGLISPVEFIHVAEESGLIVPLGQWALHRACQDVAAWHAVSGTAPRLSINLSPRQFRQRDIVGSIEAALRSAQLPPSSLTVELTENVLMDNDARSRGMLQQLRALGVRVAIDDFGTGYCGLGYLREFPVDVLKIDRSFVRDIPMRAADVAIVRAIIAMARSLRLRTVAEGVESPDQKLFLAAEGCDEAQGFLFGRPIEAAQLGGLTRAVRADGPGT